MSAPESPKRFLGRTALEWLSSLPVFLLLMLTLVISTGEMLHGRLLHLGEALYGDPVAHVQYFMLRADPVKPDCNPDQDIDAEVARQGATAAGPAVASGDSVDALFADSKESSADLRTSLLAGREVCRQKHDLYQRIVSHLTPGVRAFRTMETSFFFLFQVGTENRSLILLAIVALAGLTTTLGFHHICIRPPRFERDYRIQNWSVTIASALLLHSCVRYYQITVATGLAVEHPAIHVLWCLMFAALTLIAGVRSLKAPPAGAGRGTWGLALLSVPLFAQMGILSGVYFIAHNHPSGLAIYINQLMELPGIFLNLALFILAGMLLKQTRIVDQFLNILRPWRLSPEVLTYVILLGAALPTAYTGASGIFVIAAGGIIYHEVRHAGGTRQFALAATAMSGSLGVVLRPCLLVVLIAMLNKQVTTAKLYHWGFFVFLLTSSLFFLASQLRRTQVSVIEVPVVALRGMLRQLPAVLPYVAMTAAVILFYSYALDTHLNEITAPTIMPILMLILLVLDKWLNHRTTGAGGTLKRLSPQGPGQMLAQGTLKALARADGPQQMTAQAVPGGQAHAFSPLDARAAAAVAEGDATLRLEPAIRTATNETIGHIGALISLMALSLAVGGVVERSEMMSLAPQHFDNIWVAMAFLTVTKVVLGMIMDPFGAVILVSGTLAPIAYANRIDPVHFWMMVLVAFELGYLLPPVALNQLLTRQTIGEAEIDAADEEVRHLDFYHRFERWILPVAVMTVGLAIVAFVPLAVMEFDWLAPVKDLFMP